MCATAFKIPHSLLVVIHTPDRQVLLIERADAPWFWQSVTGSKDREDEPYADTAAREVAEETGIDARAPGFDGGICTRIDCIPLGVVVNRDGQRFNHEGDDFWAQRYATWGLLWAQ